MNDDKLKQALTAIAEEEVNDVNLLPEIKKNAQSMRRPRRLPYPSLTRAVASIVALVLFSAVGYAVFQNTFSSPGVSDELTTQLDISQEIEGWTAQLDWAYADANRVSLQYSIHQSEDAPPSYTESVQLTTADGQDIPSAFGGGGGGGSEGSTSARNFDVSGLDISGDTIDLILTLQYGAEPAAPTMPQGGSGGGGGGGGGTPPEGAEQAAPPPAAVTPETGVDRTFVFEFSVPFYAASEGTAENATVTDGDISATLTDITTTPSVTRARICFENVPEINDEMASPHVTLDTGSSDGETFGRVTSAADEASGCHTVEWLVEAPLEPEAYDIHVTAFRSQRIINEENAEAYVAFMAEAGYEVEVDIAPNGLGVGTRVLNADTGPIPHEILVEADMVWYDTVDVDIPFTVTFD